MSFCFLSVFSPEANAQTLEERARKNSIRAGAGINVFGADNGDKVGPSMYLGYSREVYEYFSMDLQLSFDQSIVNAKNDYNHKFGASLSGMVKPLAFSKWLSWFEAGIGASVSYMYVMYGDTDYLLPTSDGERVIFWKISNDSSCRFGFDFPIRAYFINSRRFELFAFYEFKTAFYKGGRFGLDHSICGLMFGVKF